MYTHVYFDNLLPIALHFMFLSVDDTEGDADISPNILVSIV
jgi:hypothetical protein